MCNINKTCLYYEFHHIQLQEKLIHHLDDLQTMV